MNKVSWKYLNKGQHSDPVVQAVYTSTNIRINIYNYYQKEPEEQEPIVSIEDFSYKYFNSGHHLSLQQQ